MEICRLKKVFLESNLGEFRKILKDIPYEYWGEEHFLMELNEKWKYSLVAQKDQKVMGYIIASNKIESIHIHKFMVSISSRSQGMGLELLKKFEEICLKYGNFLITLKVYKKNGRAINFYLKNGFKLENNCNNELLMMSKNIE